MRSLAALLTVLMLALPFSALAQDPSPDRLGQTGDASSNAALQSILERQQQAGSTGEIPLGARDNAADIVGQLGAGTTDDQVYRAIRLGTDDVSTQVRSPAAGVLIQTGGMRWQQLRDGPIQTYGLSLLGGMVALLALFFVFRGRIKIRSGLSGQTIQRFASIERFGHWLLASSFIILGLTGLYVLLGRHQLIPLKGPEAYAQGAIAAKWIHNNVAWAFMLSLVMIFFMWVWHNIPSPRDWQWFRQGGGIIGNGHPHSKKFNAGQKVIFWPTLILGATISASGLSLLFPFELPMFAKTFSAIAATGIPGLLGFTLPTELAPHEEMQYANLWHTIVSFVLMAIIIAHIYIGSIGMQGAFAAMGSGKVDLNWAREHHDLWVEEQEEKAAKRGKTLDGGAVAPAE
mgnify:CR=1 FL=1